MAACAAAGDRVVAVSRSGRAPGGEVEAAHAVDLLDADATRRAVADAGPEVVHHLAALASVGRSWEDPARTLRENVVATTNLLEAVRAEAPNARVVLVGSGEIYGAPDRLPVGEDAPLRPASPYAVSKAAADLLGALYETAHGLDVVRTRSFNHAGPGQSPTYAIASFAKQVAAGRRAGDDPIRVVSGNPDSRRDFTDVRDVARAYRLLAEGAPAGAYNVCSGRSTSVAEIVALLGEAAGVRVKHEVDPARVRARDVPEVRGAYDRLREATGWEPEIPLERTLADTVAAWEEALAGGVHSEPPPE